MECLTQLKSFQKHVDISPISRLILNRFLPVNTNQNDHSNSEFFSQGIVPPKHALQRAKVIARATQRAYMPDGTILSIWGVGVRQGSELQEIDGGAGVSPGFQLPRRGTANAASVMCRRKSSRIACPFPVLQPEGQAVRISQNESPLRG